MGNGKNGKIAVLKQVRNSSNPRRGERRAKVSKLVKKTKDIIKSGGMKPPNLVLKTLLKQKLLSTAGVAH